MAEAIVQDWLAEYESLQPSEMQSFASLHENNQEIAEAIYTIFNERLKYPELIHEICNQFLSFYRSKEDVLRNFPMQFIPVLIYVYLNSVTMGDKKKCRSVETLLICIYNAEITAEDGTPKVVSFRLPVLAQASIYHEEKSVPLADLRRWEENCNREIKWGPFAQIESINAQSRMKVMSALLFSYNHHLSLTQKNTLLHLCRMASQIVNQGFSKPGHAHRTSYGSDPTSVLVPRPPPRIALSSQFLVELVHAIYFAMFNGFGTIAIQTLDDIHNRGCYEMFSDVILVTSAVKNSLHANPSGQPSDGPMGLSVALTPATNTAPIVSKSMITNASFRTKKLPDDLDMEFLASLPHQPNADQYRTTAIDINNPDTMMHFDSYNDPTMTQHQHRDGTKKSSNSGVGSSVVDSSIINPLRWKTWGWKYSPGSKTSSIEEEPDSPKKSLSSSKNSSPNASPKIRKPQQAMKPAEDILNSFTNSSMVAAIRRKKSSSPAKKSPELRSSAGARLISNLEDSCDSGDEKEALLANGRPASIHIIQTASGYTIINK